MRNLENQNIEKEQNIEALTFLFDWMKHMTKETQKLHIYLASSEQFFLQWIEKCIGEGMRTLTIGDLKKEDAREYFYTLNPPLGLLFETVFELTGIFFF